MSEKILKLIGLGEYELETFYAVNRLDEEEECDRKDLEEAVRWLTDNLDHIIADAEWDGRL